MRACIHPASRARACIIGQILDALRSDHALLYACVRFAFPNRCWIYSIY